MALVKLKEEAYENGELFVLMSTKAGTRWNPDEKLKIRMNLLSNYNQKDKKLAWKSIAKLMHGRTSVQIRTHIQKRREEHEKKHKLLSEIIDHVDLHKGSNHESQVVPIEYQRDINNICASYLSLLECAHEHDKNRDKYDEPKSYIETFKENQSIPEFLYDIYEDKLRSKAKLESHLSRVYASRIDLSNLLSELQRSVYQEKESSYMDKTRCKDPDKASRTYQKRDTKANTSDKVKQYTRKRKATSGNDLIKSKESDSSKEGQRTFYTLSYDNYGHYCTPFNEEAESENNDSVVRSDEGANCFDNSALSDRLNYPIGFCHPFQPTFTESPPSFLNPGKLKN